MITHCRLPFQFDEAMLLADLQRLSANAWIRHFVAQNYDGDWSALPLRSLEGQVQNIYTNTQDPEAFRDTALLQACPYFQKVLATIECPLTSVRLMRLAAGSRIKEHVDPGDGYEYGELRLHIPITTNPQVAFFLDRQRIDMRPGECWYLNFSLPHSVENRGANDRIHLVIDCLVNDWADDLLRSLGFSVLEKYGTKIRYLDNHIEELRKIDTPEAKLALHTLLQQKAEIDAARRERAGLKQMRAATP